MLRFFIGRAGTGKTAAVIAGIKQNMEKPSGRDLLLVPEQYSHEAERELCRRCGDRLSLTAEVLSFTGLQRSMAARLGGAALPWLDKGGRMLCMALAMQSVGPRLRVYGAAQYRPELQAMLLSAVDELKSACIDSGMLQEAAGGCDGGLADKLIDLALVLEAYDSVVANGRADPADRLTRLSSQIDAGGLPDDARVWVDGFIDFTRQEQEVLFAMLRQGVELTVCLTLDAFDSEDEVFALSRHAGRALADYARELGQKVETVTLEGGRSDALAFFCEQMFRYTDLKWDGPAPVRLYRAEGVTAECEQAAALCLELVRDGGCRWRDISIVVRGYEDYRSVLESMCRHYGVPLFTAARSDLMQKPLPALIAYACEIVQDGWALDDVMGYLRTGLAGLDEAECDELERYLFKWSIRGSAWERRGDWRQHPDGYGAEYTEETEKRLARINALRRRVAGPLAAFARASAEAETAKGQAKALCALFAALKLPETLARRAEELRALGRERSAAEYRQLWELTCSALEQCAAILGDASMDGETFGRLFTRMLSCYDIGTIPVSLDRVSAGDFDRNRRRNVKHLIVLGASDARLPRTEEGGGVFSVDERQRLLELDIDLGAGGDSELWREFSLIYHTLSLPSESLTLLCPLADSEGAALRPASVFRRAQALFSLEVKSVDLTDVRMSAPAPALALAGEAIRGAGGREQAAREYFAEHEPEHLDALERAAHAVRGSLSRAAVERLYGKKLRLSASRIEKFASCRFAYFCQYGLKARPYEPAGFEPPEMGTFFHYILENVAREVRGLGGFRAVSDEELERITDAYIERYVREELNDFQEKSKRFVYLFRRLRENVRRVVADMAAELRRSDFEPLDFELDFAKASDVLPVELGGEGENLALTGVADRVDGFLHGGKLYLRVVDYKTGRKEFSLSDVWYGQNLQMLLYLFTLSEGGAARYGAQPEAAGVMYIPARSPMLSADGPEDDEALARARAKELRRSGLVLDDAAVLEAWEHGADKRYIPVKFKNGAPAPDSLADKERLGLLSRHIKKELCGMARQLRAGSIAADPWYRSNQDNACLNCDYFAACAFRDGQNGEQSRYLAKLSTEQVWAMMEEGERNG
ncbi:MAG: PD-(D/E)XK nuclease family protein [Oscillospiraceae bacterium]|nr:PD-(D/E)XK nuclease family protein [Oscillospiraceae bacterium]